MDPITALNAFKAIEKIPTTLQMVQADVASRAAETAAVENLSAKVSSLGKEVEQGASRAASLERRGIESSVSEVDAAENLKTKYELAGEKTEVSSLADVEKIKEREIGKRIQGKQADQMPNSELNIPQENSKAVDLTFPNDADKPSSWSDCLSGQNESRNVYDVRCGRNSELLNSSTLPDNSVINVQTETGNTMTMTTDGLGRSETYHFPKMERIDGSRDITQQMRCRELKDGLPTDDAGHILAREFGGPSEQFNYLPMDSHTNRYGEWRNMERDIGRHLDTGKEITDMNVRCLYDGTSRRPDGFEASYCVDGHREYRYIDNTPRI